MRRTFWVGAGYTLGVLTTIYARRRIRRAVHNLAPRPVRTGAAAVGTGLASHARAVADRVTETVVELRDAAGEGLDTMRRERSDLQAEFGPDRDLHRGPARGLGAIPDSTGGFRPRH